MLVIGRNESESFVVGQAIVHIVTVSGRHVKVGIDAPRSVLVLRSELVEPVTFESIQAEARKGHKA